MHEKAMDWNRTRGLFAALLRHPYTRKRRGDHRLPGHGRSSYRAGRRNSKSDGYKINWKQFGGGGEVIKAMASGAVQIGRSRVRRGCGSSFAGRTYELF
jgi:tripartite-type tricarboxylate transporter receptor subunit TctC